MHFFKNDDKLLPPHINPSSVSKAIMIQIWNYRIASSIIHLWGMSLPISNSECRGRRERKVQKSLLWQYLNKQRAMRILRIELSSFPPDPRIVHPESNWEMYCSQSNEDDNILKIYMRSIIGNWIVQCRHPSTSLFNHEKTDIYSTYFPKRYFWFWVLSSKTNSMFFVRFNGICEV